MSGISAETCISLILQHIGGIPLKPTSTAFVEGSPVAKQLAMGGFSLPGLEMLQGSLNGLSTSSMLGNVFQNPVGEISASLASVAGSLPASIETAFVTTTESLDPITGLPVITREVAGNLAGKLSLDQIDALKTNITGLGAALPTYQDLTNKISGVSLPSFETAGDFGLQQVAAVQSSFESLANNIPSELNAQTGGLKEAIGSNLDKITKPIGLQSDLTSAKYTLDNAIAELNAVSTQSSSVVAAKYNEIMNNVSTVKNLVTTTTTESKSVMGTFVNGAQSMGYVETVAGSLTGSSVYSKNLVNSVVKPTPLQQIKTGIETYAPGTLQNS